jgi:hypothetical protein
MKKEHARLLPKGKLGFEEALECAKKRGGYATGE